MIIDAYRYAQPADPLAAISFVLRMQTHLGDGVPMGTYTDTATPTPAVAEGDAVAGFKDELSGGDYILAQSDGSKAPTLHFESGVPMVRLDGSDDCLTKAFSLAQPNSLVLAYRNRLSLGPGDHDIVCDGASQDNSNFTEDNRPYIATNAGAGGVVAVAELASSNVFAILAVIFDGADSKIRVNGVERASGNAGSFARDGLTLGSTSPGRTAGIDVIAALMPVNSADVPAIEAYLATLLP